MGFADMSTWAAGEEDMKEMCDWILCGVILHIFARCTGETPSEVDVFDPDTDAVEVIAGDMLTSGEIGGTRRDFVDQEYVRNHYL